MIDQLKAVVDPSESLSNLGPFYKFIPDIDLMICTDMGTEPADFILSSPTKLVFVHIKCGKAQRPHSSAGALAEVGGQAIKNLSMLISDDEAPGNKSLLLENWPSKSEENGLKERIRLYKGKRHESSEDREKDFDEVWGLINERRKIPSIEKEIWVVAGRSFSKDHFKKQLIKGTSAQAESLQAYQLIQSWIAESYAHDVNFKLFVNP